MLTELEPCPFCGDRLEARGVNYRHSPDSECVLAHIRVTPTDIDAWNRRAASEQQAARELSDVAAMALYESAHRHSFAVFKRNANEILAAKGDGQ